MRLTIDLDNSTEKRALGKARLLFILFGNAKYRRSSGGHGYHVVSHDTGLTPQELRQYRLVLGDDEKRVSNDCRRSRAWLPTQILFSQKGEKKAGEWVRLHIYIV